MALTTIARILQAAGCATARRDRPPGAPAAPLRSPAARLHDPARPDGLRRLAGTPQGTEVSRVLVVSRLDAAGAMRSPRLSILTAPGEREPRAAFSADPMSDESPLIRSLRAAVAAAPEDVPLRLHFTELLLAEGRHDEAVTQAAVNPELPPSPSLHDHPKRPQGTTSLTKDIETPPGFHGNLAQPHYRRPPPRGEHQHRRQPST